MTATPPPVTAVLLAGGTGTRLGGPVPKQLIEVAGKPILAHTLDAFEGCRDVDDIVLLMAAGHVAAARAVVDRFGYAKVSHVGEGGATRDGSARAALALLADRPPESKVLLHDAVRPLITPDRISACVAALGRHRAVTVAVPATDTILAVAERDGTEVVVDIPDRRMLRQCQTPQGFRLGLLAECHARAAADAAFVPTDDCGVVRRYAPDEPIAIVAGDGPNLKVTHAHDVTIVDRILKARSVDPDAVLSTRVGKRWSRTARARPTTERNTSHSLSDRTL